jgi:hypothetical protein
VTLDLGADAGCTLVPLFADHPLEEAAGTSSLQLDAYGYRWYRIETRAGR